MKYMHAMRYPLYVIFNGTRRDYKGRQAGVKEKRKDDDYMTREKTLLLENIIHGLANLYIIHANLFQAV